MNEHLSNFKKIFLDPFGYKITEFKIEPECKNYQASKFKINKLDIISRTAKITPKKNGQFVTFWKRNINGIIEPFHEKDPISFFLVNLENKSAQSLFIFPKSVLIEKGILSTTTKEGKRGFRVYPSWELPKSKQAIRTQNWQLAYFVEFNNKTNHQKLLSLLQKT